jgi:transposase
VLTADETQGGGKFTFLHWSFIMLGIDVSKDTLSCTLLDPVTRHVVWHKEISNTPAGYKQLLRYTPAPHPWVLEPTGRYSQDVARAAREAGRDVRLAQPKKAQSFFRSMQSRAKTDKLDAKGLAFYGLSCNLAPYPLKTPMQEEVDQLLSARRGLSQSLSELQARQRDLPRAAQTLAPAIAALKEQIKAADRQLAKLNKTPEFQAVKELQKVPGIGPVVAMTLVSRLSARSFGHPDQFVAYCGLDIRVLQSGKKRGELGLSKQGESELRRLLYLAAKASLRSKDTTFKEQYEREMAKGLSKTAALCAVARKMARLCWSMVRHGSTYDPNRVFNQKNIQQNSSTS